MFKFFNFGISGRLKNLLNMTGFQELCRYSMKHHQERGGVIYLFTSSLSILERSCSDLSGLIRGFSRDDDES